jgi:hypothetical protein
MATKLGTFVCRKSERNNGIMKLHFQRNAHDPAHQPEDAYFNLTRQNIRFREGRKYQIIVVDTIDDEETD